MSFEYSYEFLCGTDSQIPRHAFISNHTCHCNIGYTGQGEVERYDDCHIRISLFLVLYGVTFFTYIFLFTRTFFVTTSRRRNYPQSRRLLVYHYFIGIFSGAMCVRILMGMAGYRYYEKKIIPSIIFSFAIGSWLSSIIVLSSLWFSSFLTLTRVANSFLIDSVSCFMVTVAYILSFVSQVIPTLPNEILPKAVSVAVIVKYSTITLVSIPLITSLLTTVLRILVWYPIFHLAHVPNEELKNLQSETEKIVISMTICYMLLAFIVLVCIFKSQWFNKQEYIVIASGFIFIGVMTMRESAYFNPKTSRVLAFLSTHQQSVTAANIVTWSWSTNLSTNQQVLTITNTPSRPLLSESGMSLQTETSNDLSNHKRTFDSGSLFV